jgi:hypothetical protein
VAVAVEVAVAVAVVPAVELRMVAVAWVGWRNLLPLS